MVKLQRLTDRHRDLVEGYFDGGSIVDHYDRILHGTRIR